MEAKMDRNEFIAKLQMVYVGDINALNEIIGVYDNLKEENQRLINVLRRIRLDLMFDYKNLNVKKLNSNDLTDNYWLGYIHACEEVFDIMNELKESDK
jgi:predicted DNA-binding transcriptional regulator